MAEETGAFVPVTNALGVIAFGNQDAFVNGLPVEGKILEKWGHLQTKPARKLRRSPLALAMRRLLARGWWWKHRARRPCPIEPPDPEFRRHLRQVWRRQGKRKYPDLLSDLLGDLAEYSRLYHEQNAAWRKATETLIAAASEQRITLIGRRGTWRNRSYSTNRPEQIQPEFFANEFHTILADGWAAVDCDRAPIDEWPKQSGVEYGDVKVPRLQLENFVTSLTLALSEEKLTSSTEVHALAVADQACPAPSPIVKRNKTGPKRDKRESIAARMASDYAERAEVLANEKVVVLTATYGGAKDTVRKAREHALAELWKNSGKVLDTGK